MGGIADYSGSLVLEMPINLKARVGVTPRIDGLLKASSVQAASIGAKEKVQFHMEEIKNIETFKNAIAQQPGSEWAAYIIGCALLLTGTSKNLVRDENTEEIFESKAQESFAICSDNKDFLQRRNRKFTRAFHPEGVFRLLRQKV